MRTYCTEGHAFSSNNTSYNSNGSQICRICRNAKARARYALSHPKVDKRSCCRSGHEYTPENTYVYPNGRRKCRSCARQDTQLFYQRHKIDQIKWQRDYYKKASGAILSEQRKRYRATKRHLELKYNLPKSYAEMVADQNGLCKACNRPPDSRGLCVDHDHACCPAGSCGQCVRGLLCNDCNTALGLTGDSVDRLEQLITYLVEDQKRRGLL